MAAAGRAERLRAYLEFPTCRAPRPSADGRSVYFLSNAPGHPTAFRVPVAGGPAERLLPGPERVGAVRPAPVGDRLIVATDAGGNERWALAARRPDGAVERAFTARPDRIHEGGAWRDDRRFVYRSNERDERYFDLWEVDLGTEAAPRLVRREDARVGVLAADRDRLLAYRATTNIDRDLLLMTEDGERLLNPRTGEQAVMDADLTPDGAVVATNPDREFCALVRYPRSGGAPETLAAPAGDVEVVAADRTARRVAYVVNDRGYSRLFVREMDAAHDVEVGLPEPGVVESVGWVPGSEALVFDLNSARSGGRLCVAERAGGPIRVLAGPDRTLPAPPVPPALRTARMSDGLEVPYWEYVPTAPPRATVVFVHGGPESQARPGFHALIQFWIAEGYRVVAPNVRGSLGYGRTYLHLDDVRKRMDAVRDLREVVAAVRAGDAGGPWAGRRIGVFGGSYGGFMVLAALTTYPELFDAGVDVVGISNFVTFLERTGPWRRKVREDEYGSLANDREFLRSISPLHAADRIRAPLLVVHGANDPRVPLYEAEQIVAALEQRRVPVEFLKFDDEGHGLARRANQRLAYERAAAFFDRHLAPDAPGGAAAPAVPP
ncbi:MAG TPA: alpha/beta fold hydrolase [Thermoplasmata archaeon]|nr:alpha/beta fold hydrolase [Thermoplasmata archaeon]